MQCEEPRQGSAAFPMGFTLFAGSPIDEAIEKATSELLPNAKEDLAVSMDVCDMIKGKRVDARVAMRSLKRRLEHRNPNVQMLAIQLTDACFKNTGMHFLKELASREFVDTITEVIRSTSTSREVCELAKRHLQLWALLCRPQSDLTYVHEAYQELRRAGIPFPPEPRRIDQQLMETRAPPEWIDGDECHRCRVAFSLTQRKHHCRQCGNVFCQACSSRTASLPELGIPEPSRICEPCYVQRTESRAQLQKSAPLPVVPPEFLAEEETDPDLARAIRLSLQESHPIIPSPAVTQKVAVDKVQEEEDRMLKAAIEASLRETQHPTPTVLPTPPPSQSNSGLAELDKENVKLFSQLVDRLSLSGGSAPIEPEMEALGMAMQTLRDTLKTVIYELKQGSPEMAGLLASLEISLAKYQLLRSLPRPSQPRPPPAPTAYMPSIPPAPQPFKGYPIDPMHAERPSMPVYQPAPLHQEPNMATEAYPIPEGQLLDEEPLIKL